MKLWNVIQRLKTSLRDQDSFPEFISIKDLNRPELVLGEVPDAELLIRFDGMPPSLSPLCEGFCHVDFRNKGIGTEDVMLFKRYLPYTFMSLIGRSRSKCFAISHFAQTLDGRIATASGDSKWIGNEENLLHAHRMRALCDAILVGSRTVEKDNPKLTVRLVKGADPVRVVIGNSKLSDQAHHAIDESTIVFRESDNDEPFDCVVLKKDPYFDLKTVLQLLVEKGLFSVYIEGGSFTTSRFLEQEALDQIQIHFSPKILGSGTNSFGFGQVRNISECITFKESKFLPIGDEMMFIGNL